MVVRYFSFITKALVPSLKLMDYSVYQRIQVRWHITCNVN